ncbi:alpha-1-antitrypsin homolog [Nematolebias whitei]|uniref:alpha-1-antitrypsin homolog n=1 Tax=Nematolebias whitei TaxID=451745 RepID=UPI00189A87C1|nr:alpha-1-antitrypsin homolog [Nematolebias whitei]
MVLINWVYFRGQWLKPFEKRLTTKDDFYVDQNTKVKVDMMRTTEFFDSYHDYVNHAVILQLPYKGSTSMMLVLPDEGMADVVESRIKDSVMKWQTALSQRRIDLSMPKFSISAEASLEDILKEMGITRAFENSADFSGISEEVKLVVSKVSHKAVLSVDENGTEAAAATTIEIMAMSSLEGLTETVKINRPFFVFIVELSTRSFIFMGRINNPTLS